ncbi:energy-coupling factor transporter ATP-binding protein EcfA2 [Paenibacillus antibioticophila]|uniref:Energy-coupling factor transporter ATP-binding protein EcfA2 n=1 Tax=Paenibacillus antibioticophila TaxID=1274374 RepID=A0A919XTY4_9BACL|nr:energy-coupling factor transporter ATPase [Paenibacillus antibioticophila]GIO37934.1 energy-coupling factor transporter ATP-binding protein EcfA2 [Paenibacillus antibioticophila]
MAVDFEKVSFAYDAKNMWSHSALHEVSLHLEEGVFAGIAGATGSGKSTLLQHFNGLLKPTEGKVRILDFTLEAGGKPLLQELRRRVGLVFQFPEQQLFEDTVEKDLMFGPLNFGMDREAARQSAIRALRQVGLDESFLPRNPFHLSGGQMRKVAIASVLAMDPEVIILDEPTATLDPESRAELAELLGRMQQEEGKTVIVVTHRIEEMLPYAGLWIVMHQGKKVFQGSPAELVHEAARLESEYQLAVPACIKVWNRLAEQYGLEQEAPCLTAEQTAARISRLLEAGDIERKGGG